MNMKVKKIFKLKPCLKNENCTSCAILGNPPRFPEAFTITNMISINLKNNMCHGSTCNDLYHPTKVQIVTTTRLNVFTKLSIISSLFIMAVRHLKPATMHKIPLQTGIEDWRHIDSRNFCFRVSEMIEKRKGGGCWQDKWSEKISCERGPWRERGVCVLYSSLPQMTRAYVYRRSSSSTVS